jgi:hypothetical protein
MASPFRLATGPSRSGDQVAGSGTRHHRASTRNLYPDEDRETRPPRGDRVDVALARYRLNRQIGRYLDEYAGLLQTAAQSGVEPKNSSRRN